MSDAWDDRKKALEEDYFRRKELEAIEKLRAQRMAEEQAQQSAASALQCPRCDGTLEEITYEEVLIDRCNKCGGVWLDPGELGHERHDVGLAYRHVVSDRQRAVVVGGGRELGGHELVARYAAHRREHAGVVDVARDELRPHHALALVGSGRGRRDGDGARGILGLHDATTIARRHLQRQQHADGST